MESMLALSRVHFYLGTSPNVRHQQGWRQRADMMSNQRILPLAGSPPWLGQGNHRSAKTTLSPCFIPNIPTKQSVNMPKHLLWARYWEYGALQVCSLPWAGCLLPRHFQGMSGNHLWPVVKGHCSRCPGTSFTGCGRELELCPQVKCKCKYCRLRHWGGGWGDMEPQREKSSWLKSGPSGSERATWSWSGCGGEQGSQFGLKPFDPANRASPSTGVYFMLPCIMLFSYLFLCLKVS